MLRKEVPVKVEIVTLRKTIALQIVKRPDLKQGEYDIVGWSSAKPINWRNGTGLAILVVDNVRNDYAFVMGHSVSSAIVTRFGEEADEHIYVK